MVKKRKVLDHKMIPARNKATLFIPGQFSTKKRHPRYKVKISATVKSRVSCEEKMIGTEDKYVVVVKVHNRNDSLAFVTLIAS